MSQIITDREHVKHHQSDIRFLKETATFFAVKSFKQPQSTPPTIIMAINSCGYEANFPCNMKTRRVNDVMCRARGDMKYFGDG